MEQTLNHENGAALEGAEAVLQRYKNSIFCERNTCSADQDFGLDLEYFVGEAPTPAIGEQVKAMIISHTETHFPEVAIRSIVVTSLPPATVLIELQVVIVPYGQNFTITHENGA